MLKKVVIDSIKQHYGFSIVEDIKHIPDAQTGIVYKVKIDGKYYVVKKMHRSTKLSGLLYMNEVTSYLNKYMPEVATLEKTSDDKAYMIVDDSVLVVGKWLSGEKVSSCEPWVVKESAEMLAKLHKYALYCPIQEKRADHTTYEDLDWERNPLFNMDTVKRVLFEDSSFLYNTTASNEHQQVDYILSKRKLILEEHEKMKCWMKKLMSSGRQMLSAPIHGDIYHSNLLWLNKRISAVIDWDECQYAPLVYELGRVLWEFCKDSEKETIDKDKAEIFLSSYFNAYGPVPRDQLDLILPYIRMLRIVEVLFYIVNAVIGDYWNASYSAANVRALENLPEIFSFE